MKRVNELYQTGRFSELLDLATQLLATNTIRLANVRFLAGYRREWLVGQDIVGEIRS
jgi:hypothetical protein